MISNDQQHLVDRLVEEFMDRQQKGEAPSIDEYCERHPELAEEMRDVFEALMMVEDLKPGSQDESGTFGKSVPVGQRLDQVGDYRILNEIGRGGMGIVYEAEQLSLGRRVAVKVLPQQVAGSGKALARFQREAKAAARMHHTNIVPVFDVGTANGHVYYAMQLIQGQGLDLVIDDLQRMRQLSSDEGVNSAGGDQGASKGSPRCGLPAIAQSLVSGHFQQVRLGGGQPADADPAVDQDVPELTATVDVKTGSSVSASLPGNSDVSTADEDFRAYHNSVAEIGQQAASALAYAHARGIIHRDIKPSNLLLDSAGIVWVTDFGLAKTGDEALTHTGDVLGTIRYMSPERFGGRCDVRADIYALGLTLYELLTLKPAYSASDQGSLIGLINKTDPATPRSIDPRIPRDLETIVLKAIDKEPRRRYQSADEMEEDLQRFINDEPIKARRVSLVERFTRWSRRNKSLAATLMLAAVLLLIINIAGPVMTLRLWRLNADLNVTKDALTVAKDEAVQERLVAIQSRELAIEAQEQLERELYNSDMQGMRVVYQDGNMREARRLLTKYITNDESRDFRGWEWYYWWRATHLESRERWITYRLSEMVVAPDESWIVVKGYENRVQVLDNQTWGIEHDLDLESIDIESPQLAVSVDGKLLAGLSTDGRVRLWQTGDWSELDPLQASRDQTMLSFSNSGLLATGDAQGRVTLWDVQQRSMVGTPLETGQSLRTLSFSPDGNDLLTAGRVSEVGSAEESTRRGSAPSLLVWHLPNRTTETIDLDGSDEADVVAVRWTPRGTGSDSIIAAAFSDGTIRLLSGATFAQLHQVIANGSVETIALSSDGSRLAASTVTTKSVQVWETETAEQISEIRAHSRRIRRLAFTENGKSLLSTAMDGRLKSWKIEQARPYFQMQAQDVLSGKSAVEFAADHELVPRLCNINKVRMMSAVSDEKQVPSRLGRLGTNGCDENLVYTPVYKRESTNHASLEIWKTDGAQPVLFHQTTIANPSANPKVLDISICDDGSVVAWNIDGEVFVLKVGTRELMRLPSSTDDTFRDLTLSPDGKSLVVWVGKFRRNETWDVSGNQPVKLADLEGWLIRGARFSPDGTRLAQGYSYDGVRVVNSRTGETIHQFVGHAGHVNFVTFSPDGRRLASAGADGVVRLWNLDSSVSEQCMLALAGHRDEIDYVAFAPDGNSLLSSSVDGDVRIWPIVDREVDPRLLGERVVLLIEQEQFDEARALLKKLVANPWNGRHRNFEMRLGLLHAYLRDREEHENYSRELLTRFASSQSPFDLHCCAKTYLIMPGPHDPQLLDQAIKQARRCTELGADSYYIDWFECCRGIAELRAGADTEAIEWLRKATDGQFDDVLRPLSRAYRAMAEFRLGHTVEAKRLLREAEQWTSREKPAGEHWQNALYCRVAVEEANSLIHGEPHRHSAVRSE